MNSIEVVIYTVDVFRTASVRAKGHMDVPDGLTRTECIDQLMNFLAETKRAALPDDDSRFLLLSATFPEYGEISVTGLGVERELAPEVDEL